MALSVIESNFDTLTFERAYIADDGLPRAVIDGVDCTLETKAGALAAGLAFVQPLNSATAENWPVYSDLMVDGHQMRFPCLTDHPRLVAAARRFQELDRSGLATPGTEL